MNSWLPLFVCGFALACNVAPSDTGTLHEVRLEGAPPDATVRCEGCPGIEPSRVYLAGDFPVVAASAGTEIRLTLAAWRHRPVKRTVVLTGNVVNVDARLPEL